MRSTTMYFAKPWRALAVSAFFCLFGAVRAAAAAPVITIIYTPLSGTYASSFEMTVYFNQDVVVTGAPTLGIQIGSGVRQVPYSGKSSSGGLIFSYQPVSGDNGPLTVSGPLSLNGGAIKGADGTDAVLSFSPISVSSYIIDTTPPPRPVFVSFVPTPLTAGQVFAISGTAEAGSAVVFRENVRAQVDNTGHWTAQFGPVPAGTYTYEAYATDLAGNRSGPVTLTFTVYPGSPAIARPVVTSVTINGEVGAPLLPQVQVVATGAPFTFTAPGLAAYGLSISSTGLIGGTPAATATDVDIPVTADNAGGTSAPAVIRLNIGPAAAPVVTRIIPPSGTSMNVEYRGWIYIAVVFTKTVYVTGTPTLTVRVGSTDTTFRGSYNGQSVLFSFQATDASVQGPLTITGPVNLNGGSIKDADGRDAVLSFDPVATTFVIDTIPPAAPVIDGVNPGMPAPGQAFTVSGRAEPGVALWFLLDLVGNTTADANGDWSMTFSGRAPGVYHTLVYAEDAVGNDSHWQRGGPSGVPVTVTVQAGPPVVPPVVSNASVTGQVGAPITPVQVSASNTPAGFDAPGLAAYGLSIDATGLITGTPTTSTAGAEVPVTASNTSGPSAPATLHVTISTAPSSTPVIRSIESPPAGIYNGSRQWGLGIAVVFDQPITVTGQPTLGIHIGSAVVQLRGGSSSGARLGFMLDPSLFIAQGPLSITGPIDLNGGSIKGADGTDAILTFAPVDVPAVVIDTIPPPRPIVTGVTPASPTSEQAFTIAGTGEPAARIEYRIGTVNRFVDIDANGNWSLTAGPLAAGSYNFDLNVTDLAGNSLNNDRALETVLQIVVQPATTPLSPPVVSGANITGQVGVAITPVQVSATNNPTAYSAPGLGDYGLTISASGLITGTPTTSTTGANVPVTASNSAGTSAPVAVRIAISQAETPPPPPPPLPPPPPPPTSTPQTVTFSSPVSSVVIGQPITLGATSSAGLPITYMVVSGDAVLSGNTLTPRSTATLVVRASSAGNATYSAASTDANFGNPQKAAQAISANTSTRTARAGSTVALDASTTSGLPVTYTLVSGPATLSGNSLTLTGPSGTVLVRASQAGSDTVAPAGDVTLRYEITPVPISRLVNISSRLNVSASDSAGASIAGFVVTGGSPKQFLIRGVGPALARFGVGGPLAAPQLKLYDSAGNVIATNSGWNNDAQISAAAGLVGAFSYDAGSRDAGLLVTLAPGGYTVQILSASGGNALIEVYDVAAATASTKQLVNISTRGTVGTGDAVLIAGFVISGDQPKRVLIRGIGPALAAFVSGALADSVLTVFDARQNVVARNDNWGVPQPVTPGQQVGNAAEVRAANAATGAFALPEGSNDAVLLLSLDPGSYSAVVTGANNTSGPAMVEVYEVP